MFELKSYIKNINKKGKYSSLFIEISDVSEIKKFKNLIDMDYIEGAITIKYYSEYILDFSYWDYVDQLWGYFLDLIERFIMCKEAAINFPDQPVKIILKEINSKMCTIKILSKNENKTFAIPTLEFISSIIAGYEEFCSFFEQIFEIDMREEYIKIQSIREKLKI